MKSFDVLVIGTGLAGCTAAIHLAEGGLNVALVTKAGDPLETNTWKAQGGIVYRGEDDSPELLKKDIMDAGAGACREGAVEKLARDGPQIVREFLIERLGVDFTVSDCGDLDRTTEAAHSVKRIIHSADSTGRAIERAIFSAILNNPNIEILTSHTLVDLLTYEHNTDNPAAVYEKPFCLGAYLLDDRTRTVEAFAAKATVLATGGLGQIFRHTSNGPLATGDGFAAAYRAGGKLINMEYVQFHPTTLYSTRREECDFLITEALRGEGGRLKTLDGREFMEKYHELGSLAPRDVVARAMHEEMLAQGSSYLALDIASYVSATQIKKRFPGVYARCLEEGVDITREPIPVVPAAHFACGGVKVSLHGRTSIGRLYAVGEVACTGVHGANRLASISLLECVVWGRAAADHILSRWGEYKEEEMPVPCEWVDTGNFEPDPALVRQDFDTLKSIMWNYVGLIRGHWRLKRAVGDLNNLWASVEDFYKNAKLTRELVELRNGVQTGLVIARAALRNKESRGAHYRKD
ncbi:MAG: L-aspartate oxidase [Thermoplasmata archaeon HGW-Thermoplasmata-1]|nr:MAG: L-aspartate oxidase [Thermoplasmata archaeon HGW-Thermoplasmata-1]